MKTKVILERTVIYEDGSVEKIKLRKEKVIKQIKEMLEKDKEMLSILEKL